MREIFILIQDITTMIFKFYKRTVTQSWLELNQTEREAISAPFTPLYEQYDVKVIGAWWDKYDKTKGYQITAYRDEEHYEQFIESMKTHPEYQNSTEKLKPYIVNQESATLIINTNFRRIFHQR